MGFPIRDIERAKGQKGTKDEVSLCAGGRGERGRGGHSVTDALGEATSEGEEPHPTVSAALRPHSDAMCTRGWW